MLQKCNCFFYCFLFLNSVPFCQISKILTSAVIEHHMRDIVLSAVHVQFFELCILLLAVMLLLSSHYTDEGTEEKTEYLA